MTVPEQHIAEAKLDDVFWTLCKSHYIERDNPLFPDDCVFKLFRIFSQLGEMVENDEGHVEVGEILDYFKWNIIQLSINAQ